MSAQFESGSAIFFSKQALIVSEDSVCIDIEAKSMNESREFLPKREREKQKTLYRSSTPTMTDMG